MGYDKEMIKLVQRKLNNQTPVKLSVDGIVGEKTLNALLFIGQVPNNWNPKRQVISYIQYLCAIEGINAGPIDGYLGPQTETAYEELCLKLRGFPTKPWRDDEGKGTGDIIGGADWPIQTQEELLDYYGPVGENQVKVTVPYTLKIAWNKSQKVNRITCHKKVAESVLYVLETVQNHYKEEISNLGLDLFGGCLNVRKMRGGTNWSTHAWGIAIDWNPERNKLRWNYDLALFAKSEYNRWWEIWESEGWTSLGRIRDYDWMHVQACKIRKK